jgi:hypothetical protein
MSKGMIEGDQQRVIVTSKRQNYRLWQAGEYGNRLRAWGSVRGWRDSGFAGPVALRTLGDGGGPCHYDLLPDDVAAVVANVMSLGIPADGLMINESAPAGDILLQGEYLNDISVMDGRAAWGWFRHSRARRQMRDALAEAPETSTGLASDLLLRSVMTPSSYDDWRVLLDRHPGHVLEVSVYGHCLGDTPGRNALVWEVRRY